MIRGVGVDVVDVPRFERALSRTPRLADRLFAQSELVRPDGTHRPLRSLAGLFAAKEALIKALGDSGGMTWHEMRVVAGDDRNPMFELSGRATEFVASCGVTSIHVSMSHDAGIAIAYVIAEG